MLRSLSSLWNRQPAEGGRPPRGSNLALFLACSLVGLVAIAGCRVPSETAQAQQTQPGQPGGQGGGRPGGGPGGPGQGGPASVETAIARTGSLQEAPTYTGTTQPVRQASLRSQAEGRLLDLTVDVGDSVREGEVVGRLDSRLLSAAVSQDRAELAALESQVAQAQAEVSDARAQAAQAEVELQQARLDSDRLQKLAAEGAISQQQADQAKTAALSAEQVFRSAQERIRTREQAVVAAQRRVQAQQATVAETRERQSYSLLAAPFSGVVLERLTEPGNLVQPGSEIVKVGDFSALKVAVQVSELELGQLRLGQSVEVRLDAFPDETFAGRVSRISPAADPSSRLVPVEVVIPNSGSSRLGSGLLARVQFQTGPAGSVVIPEAALEAGGPGNDSVLFVVEGDGDEAKVAARPVQVGDRANGRIEILSGLQPGESFVLRSSRPLENGQPVRLSILSEG
ncbi:MAG: efflux RND transporter periplasmic adaptor subunit [Elainellaceae cyanobacterium]